MQEHLQNTMDDDYQHWEYVNKTCNLFATLEEALRFANELETNQIRIK